MFSVLHITLPCVPLSAAAFGVRAYIKSRPLPPSTTTVTVAPVSVTGSGVGVKPAHDTELHVVETMEEGMKAALDGVKGLPVSEGRRGAVSE